jgi:hypothetical protein
VTTNRLRRLEREVRGRGHDADVRVEPLRSDRNQWWAVARSIGPPGAGGRGRCASLTRYQRPRPGSARARTGKATTV